MKLIFQFRKLFPTNNIFYIVFFFFKFYGIILCTHNIKGFENKSKGITSVSTVLSRLLFFNTNFRLINNFYSEFSLIIFLLLCLFIIGLFIDFYFILKIYKGVDNEVELKIKKIDKLYKGNIIQYFRLVLFYFMLIILIFGQHIIFYLSAGIFIPFLKSNIESNSKNYSLDKNSKYINSFFENNIIPLPILPFINIVSCIIIYIIFFIFIKLNDSRAIYSNYGTCLYQNNGIIIITFFTFLFLPLISIDNLFSSDLKKKFRLILNICAIFICSIFILFNFKKFNFNKTFVNIFNMIIIIWCWTSGVIELIIYYFIKKPTNQIFSTTKLLLEIFNSISCFLFIDHINTKYFERKLTNNLFQINEKKISIGEMFIFIHYLEKYFNNDKKSFYHLFLLIYNHKNQCVNKKCPCNYIKLNNYDKINIYQDVENNQQKMYFGINSFHKSIRKEYLVIIGEQEIVNKIYQLCKGKKNKYLNTYCLYHVYYLYYFKKNLNLALYFAGKYFDSQMNFEFTILYYFYEIKKQIIKEIHFKNGYKDIYEEKNYIYELKFFYNFILLIKIIKEILYKSCFYLQKIFKFKKNLNIQNKLNKFTYQFFLDFLKSCKEINEFNVKLETLLSKYYYENNKELISNKEISYLLSNYYFLVYHKIPNEVSKYFINVTNYTYIENVIEYDFEKLYYKYPLIIGLSMKDSFDIIYINSILLDFLSYSKDQIVGKDFHILLPSQIAHPHKLYFKQFLFIPNADIKRKNSFLLNNERYIINCSYHCKLLPNFKSEFYIITNVDVIEPDQKDRMIYSLMLDNNFNYISFSKNFEEQFFFSLKMFEQIKISFCDFFGLNSAKIKKIISQKRKGLKFPSKKYSYELLKEINNSTTIFSNISQEKIFTYRKSQKTIANLNPYSIEYEDEIYKNNIYNGIMFLDKHFDEIGLDIEWYNRVKCLAERLKIPYMNNSIIPKYPNNTLEEKEVPLLYVKYYYKIIGNFSYYLLKITEVSNTNKLLEETALIKRKLTFITTVIEGRKSFLKMQIKKRNLGSILDTISPQMNMDMTLDLTNNSNSKVHLTNQSTFFHKLSKFNNDISNHELSSTLTGNISISHNNTNDFIKNKKVKKKKLNNKKENDDIEIISGEKMELLLEKYENDYNFFFRCLYCLFLLLFIFEFVVIYIRYSLNKTGKQFIISELYFSHLKIDIYSNSLNILYFCNELTDDENVKELTSLILINKVNSILVHYSKYMDNLKKISKYSKMNQYFKKLYEDLTIYIIEDDWKIKTRTSNIIEEINIFQYSINILISNEVKYNEIECRLKKMFFNEAFLNNIYREEFYKNESGPSNEEQLLFYVLYNIIQNFKPKFEDLTNEMIQILINQINSFTYVLVMLLDLLLIMLMIPIIILYIKMYQIDKIEIKIILSHLYIIEPNHFFFEKQIQFFRELIYEFTDTQIELFENAKKGRFKEPTPIKKLSNKNLILSQNEISSSSIESPLTNFSRKPLKTNKLQQINFNEQLSKFKKPNLMPKTLIIGIIVLLLFISLLVLLLFINILISTKERKDFIYSIILSLNYMERLPKAIELMLYTHLSIIVGNSSIISGKSLDSYKGNNNKFLNYYQYDLDYEKASQIQSLSDSYFSNLFLENIVIKQSIDKFIAKPLDSLSYIKEWQIKFTTKNYFCLYSSLGEIIFKNKKYDTILDFFTDINYSVDICNFANNKINEYGIETEYDYFYQEITNLYKDFYLMENKDDLKIKLLNDPDKNRMINNIQIPFRFASNSFGYWFLNDLLNLMNYHILLHEKYFILILVISFIMIIVVYFIQKINYEMKMLILFFSKLF